MDLKRQSALRMTRAIRYLNAGNISRATTIHDKIVLEDPEFFEIKILQAIICNSCGMYPEAMTALQDCLRTRPEFETNGFSNLFGKSYLDLANDLESTVLKLIEDHRQKNPVYGEDPALPLVATYHLALVFHIQGKFDEARKLYHQCLSDSVGMGEYVGTIINLVAALEEQMGNEEEARKWVDLDTYPLVYEPNETIAGMSVVEFNNGLYAEVMSSEKYQHWQEPQSKNWFSAREFNQGSDTPFISKLESIFIERAERVMDQIAEISPVPDHPGFGRRPKKFRIDMFAAGLKSGGHIGPHVHSGGFMSGNYYVRVPQIDDSENTERGCVQFGKTLFHGSIGFERKCRTFRPVEGMMLAWPSYLSHSTIPCGTDQSRMVIGYDIVPVVA